MMRGKKKLLVVGESKQLCWLKQIKPLPAEYTAYTSTLITREIFSDQI